MLLSLLLSSHDVVISFGTVGIFLRMRSEEDAKPLFKKLPWANFEKLHEGKQIQMLNRLFYKVVFEVTLEVVGFWKAFLASCN